MKIHPIALPTIFGMKTVNSFVLKGDEVVLIDAGENTPDSFETLTAELKRLGLGIADIDRIIITHSHVDHIGMAQRIAEEADARVWVNKETKAYALDPKGQWNIRKKLILGTIRSFFPQEMHEATERNYLAFSGKMADVWLPLDPDLIEIYPTEGAIDIAGSEWTSIYMPGHSNTQSTFYHEKTGAYLAADMLLKISSTPVIEPCPHDENQREQGIVTMLESYKKLAKYDLKTVYPGHYEVFNDGNRMIDIHLSRIMDRVEQCFQIISSKAPEPISFLDLFQEMYKGRWNMPALIMQIGYLDLLENQGRIGYNDSLGYKRIVKA